MANVPLFNAAEPPPGPNNRTTSQLVTDQNALNPLDPAKLQKLTELAEASDLLQSKVKELMVRLGGSGGAAFCYNP